MNSKVQRVMHEFGSGKLKSSSGQKVSNPKQAIAIALSESRRAKRYEGGGAVETGKKQEYVRVEGDAAKAATVATKQATAAGARAERAAPQDIKNQLQDVANERAAAAFELRKKSGMAKGGIAKANTHHGKLDLPFKQLNRMAGMKGGGSVKKYAKGNIVSKKDYDASGYSTLRDYLNNQQKKTRRGETAEQNEAIQSEALGQRQIANMAKMPAPSPSGTKDMRDVLGDRAVKQAGKLTDPGGGENLTQDEMRMFGAKKGGSVKKFKEGGVSEDMRAATRETVANRRQAADERDAVVEAKRLGAENARKDAKSSRAYTQASRDYQREMALNPPGTVSGSLSKFTDTVGDKMRGVGKLLGSNRVTSMDDTAQMQAREDVKGYKKGGFMKESKMKHGGMARGGMKMPMSMMSKLRTPTMAATRLGAVPAMAKGGGIESKGKTKGKVIKMAAGGSVSSASRRADGIAQRGKTRC